MSLQRQKGFSLIEIMIALGLLGVVTLFGTKIVQESVANRKANQASIELAGFLSTMNRTLVDPIACGENFLGQDATRTIGSGEFLKLLDDNEEPTNMVRIGDAIGPNQLLNIDLIELEQIDVSSFSMTFHFSRNFKGKGLKTFSRTMQFFAEIDDGRIVSCFGVSEGTSATVDELTCQFNVLRGVFDAGVDDEGNLICRRINIATSPHCNHTNDEFVYEVNIGGDPHGCIPVSGGSYPEGICSGNQFMMAFTGFGTPSCQSLGALRVLPAFGDNTCSGNDIALAPNSGLFRANCM